MSRTLFPVHPYMNLERRHPRRRRNIVDDLRALAAMTKANQLNFLLTRGNLPANHAPHILPYDPACTFQRMHDTLAGMTHALPDGRHVSAPLEMSLRNRKETFVLLLKALPPVSTTHPSCSAATPVADPDPRRHASVHPTSSERHVCGVLNQAAEALEEPDDLKTAREVERWLSGTPENGQCGTVDVKPITVEGVGYLLREIPRGWPPGPLPNHNSSFFDATEQVELSVDFQGQPVLSWHDACVRTRKGMNWGWSRTLSGTAIFKAWGDVSACHRVAIKTLLRNTFCMCWLWMHATLRYQFQTRPGAISHHDYFFCYLADLVAFVARLCTVENQTVFFLPFLPLGVVACEKSMPVDNGAYQIVYPQQHCSNKTANAPITLPDEELSARIYPVWEEIMYVLQSSYDELRKFYGKVNTGNNIFPGTDEARGPTEQTKAAHPPGSPRHTICHILAHEPGGVPLRHKVPPVDVSTSPWVSRKGAAVPTFKRSGFSGPQSCAESRLPQTRNLEGGRREFLACPVARGHVPNIPNSELPSVHGHRHFSFFYVAGGPPPCGLMPVSVRGGARVNKGASETKDAKLAAHLAPGRLYDWNSVSLTHLSAGSRSRMKKKLPPDVQQTLADGSFFVRTLTAVGEETFSMFGNRCDIIFLLTQNHDLLVIEHNPHNLLRERNGNVYDHNVCMALANFNYVGANSACAVLALNDTQKGRAKRGKLNDSHHRVLSAFCDQLGLSDFRCVGVQGGGCVPVADRPPNGVEGEGECVQSRKASLPVGDRQLAQGAKTARRTSFLNPHKSNEAERPPDEGLAESCGIFQDSDGEESPRVTRLRLSSIIRWGRNGPASTSLRLENVSEDDVHFSPTAKTHKRFLYQCRMDEETRMRLEGQGKVPVHARTVLSRVRAWHNGAVPVFATLIRHDYVRRRPEYPSLVAGVPSVYAALDHLDFFVKVQKT